jgi:hypothetical protein
MKAGNACCHSVQKFCLSVCYLKYRDFKKCIIIIWGEELRLRVFENKLLRRIFRPKRDEIRGEWGKLHNKKLNDLSIKYYLDSQEE